MVQRLRAVRLYGRVGDFAHELDLRLGEVLQYKRLCCFLKFHLAMVARLERILQSVEVCVRACSGGCVEVGFYIVLVVSIVSRLLCCHICRLLLRLRGCRRFLLLRLSVEKVCAAGRSVMRASTRVAISLNCSMCFVRLSTMLPTLRCTASPNFSLAFSFAASIFVLTSALFCSICTRPSSRIFWRTSGVELARRAFMSSLLTPTKSLASVFIFFISARVLDALSRMFLRICPGAGKILSTGGFGLSV